VLPRYAGLVLAGPGRTEGRAGGIALPFQIDDKFIGIYAVLYLIMHCQQVKGMMLQKNPRITRFFPLE
jgi:hypothetical protein